MSAQILELPRKPANDAPIGPIVESFTDKKAAHGMTLLAGFVYGVPGGLAG
jgi:hypothetical protein